MALLDIDELQANAILNLQLRRLAALQRQEILERYAKLEAEILEYQAILASEQRQRDIVSEELGEIVAKYGDERRTTILPVRRRGQRRGPHRRGGDGRHHHPRRLRQADPVGQLPGAAAWRQGRARRAAARGRPGRPLLRHDDAPLAAVLHQPRPRLPRQGVRAARGRPRREGPARRQPARVPAGREDRAGARHPRLHQGRVPGAGHAARPGEEDAPVGLRLEPVRRRHRDQPARGRGRPARRAGLGAPGRLRPGPHPGVPQGAVGAVHRVRRVAAPDGPGHVRRHGHEVPRRRRAARDGRRARGRVPVHRDRGRHRQAHRADRGELPPAGPRRSGHQGRQPAGGERRPGRRPRGGPRRRGPRHHGARQDRALRHRGGQRHGPHDAGCHLRQARQRGPDHRGRAQH